MRTNKTLLVSSLAGLLMAGAAGAALAERGSGYHHGPRGGMDLFERFDLNKDGEITREEVDQAHEARFNETDSNGDGLISPEEMKAKMAARIEQRQQQMFERLDSDKDGMLSAEEMQNGKRGGKGRFFDHLDANEDGKVTKEEAEAMKERMRERHGGRYGDDS